MENFDHILLFKTDIKSESDRRVVQSVLDAQQNIAGWNIDLDDEDYVLRIVSHHLKHQQIIKLITDHGYECCELK
ncbi:hypothetical protein [Pedobacter nutrimenti]|jgi:hypothetical protein|uniref:Copper chaperone n=1 Tax=Pedobacter nutrimenti TaxID=1241337 RepID=A0A318UKM4_9SPHI|nr:hypothetical protein [Pedobacter nutrimenti]PYF76996.1 hypothetical protein B0O44_101473 [Pedobacter nutrimenti]